MTRTQNQNAKIKKIDDKLTEKMNDFLKSYHLTVNGGSIMSYYTGEKICFLGVDMQGRGSYSQNLATELKRKFGFDSVILNGVAD